MTSPRYLFFKQTAGLRNYFGELCVDVSAGEPAKVFSDIASPPIGALEFHLGPRYERNSDSARLTTWFKYLAAATRFAFATRGTPVLFMVAQPPFLPLLGYAQKKLLGRKYVVWVDDVYPEVLIRRGRIRRGGLVDRVWSRMNRWLYGAAEHIFTLGPYMMKVVRQYVPEHVPSSIVPTWVDTDFVRPLPKSENPFAQQHGQVGKLTVMYSGNLGESHQIGTILEAARRLRNRSDVHFMIIGAGPQWKKIEASLREHQDPNITLLPLVPEEMLPFSLATADVAVASLEHGIEGVSMPSKTYYSMAAGSAILGLCAHESDLAYVIETHACGYALDPKDVEGMVVAIEELASEPGRLRQMRLNARTAAERHFSRAVNTRAVAEVLCKIAR